MVNDYAKVRQAWIKTLHGGARSVLDEALIWEDNIESIIYRFYTAEYTEEEVINLFKRLIEDEYRDYMREE